MCQGVSANVISDRRALLDEMEDLKRKYFEQQAYTDALEEQLEQLDNDRVTAAARKANAEIANWDVTAWRRHDGS